MTFHDQNFAAVQSLGYTAEEARFLYLVAVHSGYFVPRQFLALVGAKGGNHSHTFVAKLESRGHATWREYHPIGSVYHLSSKTLYRFIDKKDLPTPRYHSVEFIRARVLLLDFILENLGFAYFETQPEKTAYFCDVLGIPKTVLPAKTYQGTLGSEPTLRYFVDRFPMYLDHSVPGGPSVITFSYPDAGLANVNGFVNHVKAYLPLFRRLKKFSFLYIANSAANFLRAEKCFSALVRDSLQADISSDLVRYFRLRKAWEQKQYSSVSTSDIEWLKEASRRFHGDLFERFYRAWASGTLSEEALRIEFEQLHAHGNASFRTCLMPVRRFGNKRLAQDCESSLHPSPRTTARPA